MSTELINCKFTFDGYDWRNILTITSPTGRTITLETYYGPNIPDNVKEVFRSVTSDWINAKYGTGIQRGEIALDKLTMSQLYEISKVGGHNYKQN